MEEYDVTNEASMPRPALDIQQVESSVIEKGASSEENVSHKHRPTRKLTTLIKRQSVWTGATLSAHDISYTVKLPGKCCGGEVMEKHILKSITGIFKPGLNAIMGSSGAGKTTFLNVIAERLRSDNIKGNILLNGRRIPHNFKCMVGFVVQEDTVMGTLTIRENLAFSAALRLPARVGKKESKELVEDVIKELGLQKCANTKIGTPFIRGVSGGERKRCNIGMELIISPPVLFLDEPTTGLDAATANSVIRQLKKVARKNRTIIFSIHQPRYSIYKLFDNLMLLSMGQTVYHGPASRALDFFEQQGYKCQQHNNPPDFFLDVINADRRTLLEVSESNQAEDLRALHDKLTQGFQESSWNKELQTQAAGISDRQQEWDAHRALDYATGTFNQLLVVAGRSFKDLVRNPQTGMAILGSSIFFALVLMGVYWKIDEDPVKAFSDRGGLFFFMITVQMFFNLGAVESYHNEKVIYLHENVSGYYRASVYFLVKVFCDIIPLRLVAASAMSVIVYFGPGLRDTNEAFFLFLFCVFMLSMTASALCLFMAYSFQTFAAAQMIMALIYMMSALYGGILVNANSIGAWFSWMQYVSMVKYTFAGLWINELKDRTFCDDSSNCKEGNDYIKEQGIDYETAWDFWVNYLSLFLMTCGLFILAYIQLRRLKREL